MTLRRHYTKPPIIEAVIDIRAELSPDFQIENLAVIHEQIKAAYPSREDVTMFQANIQFRPEGKVNSAQTQLGYLFRSADKKQIVQVRTNGFTFSRLNPYESWNSLRDEARNLWAVYKRVAKPIRAIRVAVRYINRIDIPFPMVDMRDYLRTFPEISPELPQVMAGFVMHILIPIETFGGTLSLLEAAVPSPGPDISSINLDIDLFKESTADFDSDEKVWDLLEHLRDKKNEIFEKCITDKARELFVPVKD